MVRGMERGERVMAKGKRGEGVGMVMRKMKLVRGKEGGKENGKGKRGREGEEGIGEGKREKEGRETGEWGRYNRIGNIPRHHINGTRPAICMQIVRGGCSNG